QLLHWFRQHDQGRGRLLVVVVGGRSGGVVVQPGVLGDALRLVRVLGAGAGGVEAEFDLLDAVLARNAAQVLAVGDRGLVVGLGGLVPGVFRAGGALGQ